MIQRDGKKGREVEHCRGYNDGALLHAEKKNLWQELLSHKLDVNNYLPNDQKVVYMKPSSKWRGLFHIHIVTVFLIFLNRLVTYSRFFFSF